MVHEQQNRKILEEGRNYGIGYAILNKVGNNKYETLHAFTACKDYLNDLVYIENTSWSLNMIHGFKHHYTGLFKNKRYFYLGITALPRKSTDNGNYEKRKELEEVLYNNIANLLFTIRKFENKINLFKSNTKLVDIQNIKSDYQYHEHKCIILKVPMFWFKYPFLISLYTLFIRCYFNINNNIELEKHNKTLLEADIYMIKHIHRFLSLKSFNIINTSYRYKKAKCSSDVHNYGISTWLKQIPNEKFKEKNNKNIRKKELCKL